ncbi:MAG: NusG domain II-containing protein [Acholeplasmatales bacterium]|nr:NusG domain II-containing protein [Acholeplasmatales bacterium]
MGKIRNDIILIVCLVFLIIGAFVWWIIAGLGHTDDLYVNIYTRDKSYASETYDLDDFEMPEDGIILYSVPLMEDKTINITGKQSDMEIVIKNGKAYVEESGCPGQDCVEMGSISKYGQAIICLPNLIYITIGNQVSIDD